MDSIGTLVSGEALALPDDAVTQGFAILARRRSGKSVLAGVMEEVLCRRGDPWVCLDPASAHWGIRYRDREGQPGEPSGHDVLLVGGKYADVPVEEHTGALLATIICETDTSCVIDLKMVGVTARKRFVSDFTNELFRSNETPRHIFLEEAHEFVPQVPRWEEQKLVLGAMERLIQGGGGQGIGFTLITQRPASVSKNALTQIDNLFVLRMSGPQDIKAVQEWFEHNVGDRDQLREITRSLPHLHTGEAWYLAGQEIVRFQGRMRETYHAGRTPKRGERKIAPQRVELPNVIERFERARAKHMATVMEKPGKDGTQPAERKRLEQRIAELAGDVGRLSQENDGLRAETGAMADAMRQHQEGLRSAERLRDALAAFLNHAQDVPGGAPSAAIDVDAIIAEVVRRLPADGAHVEVPAPEALRAKHLQAAAGRMYERMARLSDDDRRVMELLLGQDRFFTVNAIAMALSGSDSGGVRDRWRKALAELASCGLALKGGPGRSSYKANVRGCVEGELSYHGAKPEEVEAVERQVLYRVVQDGTA